MTGSCEELGLKLRASVILRDKVLSMMILDDLLWQRMRKEDDL